MGSDEKYILNVCFFEITVIPYLSNLCHELRFLSESKACIAKVSYTELEINFPILSL